MTTPQNAPLDASKVMREMIDDLTGIARDLREVNATLDRMTHAGKAEPGAKITTQKKRRIEAGENRLRDRFGTDEL